MKKCERCNGKGYILEEVIIGNYDTRRQMYLKRDDKYIDCIPCSCVHPLGRK